MTEWIRTKKTCEGYAIGNRNLVPLENDMIKAFSIFMHTRANALSTF